MDPAEQVSLVPEAVPEEIIPQESPPKRRGRKKGSKNKVKKQPKKRMWGRVGNFDPTHFATADYTNVWNIPSNVVFVGLRDIPGRWVHPDYDSLPAHTGEILPGLRMRLVLENGTVSGGEICEVVKTVEGSYAETEIVDPVWELCPGTRRPAWERPAYHTLVGFKVVEVLPFTASRLGQLSYMFVELLLRSKGINLARTTHRQFGQWASAIGVSINEIKAAAHPLVREMQAKAFATPLDDCQSVASVESSIKQERVFELAFLFVKWLLRSYGFRISARGTEGQLKQWAEDMQVPVDELKAALRPLVEEVEAEVFASKK